MSVLSWTLYFSVLIYSWHDCKRFFPSCCSSNVYMFEMLLILGSFSFFSICTYYCWNVWKIWRIQFNELSECNRHHKNERFRNEQIEQSERGKKNHVYKLSLVLNLYFWYVNVCICVCCTGGFLFHCLCLLHINKLN